MSGYTFSLSCPRKDCEGRLEHVTGSVYACTESSAVARCVKCGARWHVQVTLRIADRRAA